MSKPDGVRDMLQSRIRQQSPESAMNERLSPDNEGSGYCSNTLIHPKYRSAITRDHPRHRAVATATDYPAQASKRSSANSPVVRGSKYKLSERHQNRETTDRPHANARDVSHPVVPAKTLGRHDYTNTPRAKEQENEPWSHEDITESCAAEGISPVRAQRIKKATSRQPIEDSIQSFAQGSPLGSNIDSRNENLPLPVSASQGDLGIWSKVKGKMIRILRHSEHYDVKRVSQMVSFLRQTGIVDISEKGRRDRVNVEVHATSNLLAERGFRVKFPDASESDLQAIQHTLSELRSTADTSTSYDNRMDLSLTALVYDKVKIASPNS